MRKVQKFVVEGKEIFIGLEDSKRTWKLCVRCNGMIIHETSMPARYVFLSRYLQNGFPGCGIHVMYEAGFSGFWLHDLLWKDGIEWATNGRLLHLVDSTLPAHVLNSGGRL